MEHARPGWLGHADTVAALGVAAIIVGVSLRLGKKSFDDLLDRVPVELQEQVEQVAAGVAGVLQVSKVRLRRSGPETFADVTLSVGHSTSFERAMKSPIKRRRPSARFCPGPTWSSMPNPSLRPTRN